MTVKELQKEIDRLKCYLYGALLQKSVEDITDNELDTMCHLSRDSAVQKRLESSVGRKTRRQREQKD